MSRSRLALGLTTLALLFTAGPSIRAENNWDVMRDPTINRGRTWNLPIFGGQARPQPQPQRPVAAPVRRSVAPTTVVVDDKPVLPKVDPSTFVVVIGDTLGQLVRQGLEEAFAERPDVAVVDRSKADSGLVRTDFHDWPKAVRELLVSDQKITVAVMMIGANDRQAIREGDVSHEPFGERWRQLYSERIDAIAAAFAERRIPLVWIGAPPMQNNRLSTDMVALNDMFRQRVERAGGAYIDLWDGFVDAENRYSAVGPDLSGQIARLRTSDGVHFTKAGARKAAHFADAAIRRSISAPPPSTIIALPSSEPGQAVVPGVPQVAIPVERLIDQMVGLRTDLPPLPVIPVKPLAGPILPLTGPALARDGTLLASARAVRGPALGEVERAFGDGIAPVPRAGRADDFRWPRN